MRKQQYKRYDAKLKAEVAIEAIKGVKSIIEICAEHKIPQTNIYDWRDRLLKEAEEIFRLESERNKQVNQLKVDIETMHKIIGEITIENNFLKKKLQR